MTPRRRYLLAAVSAMTLLTACGSTTSTSGQSADPTIVSIAGDGTETGTETGADATSSTGDGTGTDTSGIDESGIDRHDSAGDLEWDAAEEQQIDLSSGSVTIENPGTYRLTGTLADGQVTVASDGEGKVRLILDNASITNSTGPAIFVEAADEVVIVLADGTTNSVSDGSGYSLADGGEAAIASFADLTITGWGALTVTGNTNDGINTKDGLVFGGGTVQVTAVDDGIRGKDYVVVDGSTVTVDAAGDGVKSDNDEDEGRGQVAVVSGSLTISAGDDGVKGETSVTVSGGTVLVTRAYEGLEAATVTIDGGTVGVTTSDDGLNGSALVITGGDITVDALGDGIDINGSITMTGGTVTVVGPTENMNGPIDYDGTFDISGGTIVATGSAGMAMAPSQSSSQGSLLATFATQAAGSVVEVRAADGTVVLTVTPSRQFASIALSTPALQDGVTYEIVVNGTVVASTTTADAVSQSGPGGGQGGPGGNRPQP